MPAIGQSGSEGGAKSAFVPTPIKQFTRHHMDRIRSGNPIRTFAWHTLESEVAQDQYLPIIPDLHVIADYRFGLVAGGQQLIVDDRVPLI
jgi:hypothetical protein